ncbi:MULTISPECIES: glycine betaine ABC transporter substrate-binding protein [Crystallibacter]|uniref:glycine betaine ABC transporter substrate-binding protein n=1 Tax=Crystallibacter TaxID=3456524 RepID=UPI001473C074|nr:MULTISPECIES: glycine betaine ABC transporter substrate-binding protein [unclassified Arthrobacter]MCW2134945.1 osmoprotectant transport system substrate-binding protein [Arthrobacter sp. VKM Ac-2550]NMR28740.1 glycine/betaine ABC transporter substrate-binding protein [Arthrobacter sp. SF27]
MKAMSARIKVAAALGAGMLLLTGCGGGDDGGGNGTGELAGAELAVGSKEFTESILLAQITAVALENAGATVEDRTGISGSATVREALESGEVDMYWDYTGTGWVNILGHTTEDAPEDLYAAVAEEDAQNGIVWLEPAPFDDTYRIAVKSAFAEENGLTNMTEAAAFIQENPEQGAVCAASEFINRDDGLPGLEKAYGFEFSEVVELDLNLIYTQIGESCPFGEVFSTDARVVSNDLTVLEDDKEFFVEYQGALTLRQETLDKFPAIADIMAPISAELTNEVVTELNGRVDNDGEQPRDVAEEWLKSEGLLG